MTKPTPRPERNLTIGAFLLAALMAAVLACFAFTPTPAHAAVGYLVSDDASGEVFQAAIGASVGTPVASDCPIDHGTLAASDTLTVTGAETLRVKSSLTNEGTVDINSTGVAIGLRNEGDFDNHGRPNISQPSENLGKIVNNGFLWIAADLLNSAIVLNPGTGIIDCAQGGRIHGAGTIVGNPVPASCAGTPPSISVDTTTADAALYAAGDWTNQPVTVRFLCADQGSGGTVPTDDSHTTSRDSTDPSAPCQ